LGALSFSLALFISLSRCLNESGSCVLFRLSDFEALALQHSSRCCRLESAATTALPPLHPPDLASLLLLVMNDALPKQQFLTAQKHVQRKTTKKGTAAPNTNQQKRAPLAGLSSVNTAQITQTRPLCCA
jgi:hypothetical protein